MNISELSIRRPVLATVLTIIILLFGFIGYSYLGVREYPSVDNPIISVSCSYPGANHIEIAEDVIKQRIAPEDALLKLIENSESWMLPYQPVEEKTE